MSKIRALDHLEKNNILCGHQFGFCSKRSSELAVKLFTDCMRMEADKGSLIRAIFTDLSKAFETVSHASVQNKLPSFGISGKELMWFTDYFFNRAQVVQCNGVFSEVVPLNCGVPQGSIIGPLLFMMQFNAAYKVLKHSKIMTYADDAVTYMSAISLDEIENRLCEDRSELKLFGSSKLIIYFRIGKTESMIFWALKRLNKPKSKVMEVKSNGEKISGTSNSST